MTWQPLPPSIAEWMGMDDAPDSPATTVASDHVTQAPAAARNVPQPRRPLVDLTPLIEALEAHLAAYRATHPR
ncbi:hypothetical protein [Nocardioides pacificus]